MNTSAIPTGSIPYVIYETMRAAAFLEHHSEERKDTGRRAVEKLKEHFADAYPGSADEIDRHLAKQSTFVRELIDRIMNTGFVIERGEEQILISYPQLCEEKIEKLSVLIHLIADSNWEHFQDENGTSPDC
jgi:hypothetical protein